MINVEEIYIALLINVLLLFSMGSIFILVPFVSRKWSMLLKIIVGLVSGVIGLMIMSTQFYIVEGFLLDTRSVLVSLVGAFFGFIPMVISVVITSILRISQGGAGTFTGVLVIVTTGLVGYLYGKYRLQTQKKLSPKLVFEFYLFGIVTHLVMMTCFFTLPFDVATFVLGKIFFPVMLLYPVASTFIAMVLFRQKMNVDMARKIDDISKHDYLTGVYNRFYYEKLLKELDNQTSYPLSVIVGDVNGLKIVNDSFGHIEGDHLLVSIVNIIKDSIAENHEVSRWGGDEFVILMPNTTEVEANQVVIDITLKCNQTKLKNNIVPSISLGIATKHDAKSKILHVLKQAEDLMYRNKLSSGKSVRSNLIAILENALLERSLETLNHTQNMETFSLMLSNQLDLSQSEKDELKVIAKLHDIGKIGISDKILLKQGKLTPEEFNIIKKHPEIGYRILVSIEELSHVASGVLYHHEKWDGTGYPQGLKGEEIPLLSRIVTIADSYEVMTNGRVYKGAISKEEAIEELKRCSGTQFDPSLIPIFVDIVSEL